VVSTPRKTRHWSPSWLQSSSGAINNLPVGPDLDCSQLGDQFKFLEHPCLEPQMTPSGHIRCIYMVLANPKYEACCEIAKCMNCLGASMLL
jgi:hypothetical protein